MKTTHKSRLVGSMVVLAALLVVVFLVLHRRQPLAKGLAQGDSVRQTLELPPLRDKVSSDWQAKQAQKPVKLQQSVERYEPPHLVQAQPVVKRPVAKASIHRPKAVSLQRRAGVTSSQRIMLQVASYGSLHNARAMRDRLHLLGIRPHIASVRVHNKTWYRLSAGPFVDLSSAQKAQKVIQRRWKTGAQVIHQK